MSKLDDKVQNTEKALETVVELLQKKLDSYKVFGGHLSREELADVRDAASTLCMIHGQLHAYNY